MKSILSALIGCALFVASADIASAQNTYEEQVITQLEYAASLFLDEGYDVLVWDGDSLADDDNQLYTVTLTEGYSYALVGVCDQDCSDLDLSLFDGYDNMIVQDVEVDDAPVVEFEVTSSGEFTIDVTMYECSEEPCYYGIALFEW